jgi:branched-chain amino acid transport system substrate-binding protein
MKKPIIQSLLRRRSRLVFASTIVTLALSACPANKTRRDSDVPPLTIGAILPLTGALSYYGESERMGLQLAVEQINGRKDGSPKINLVFEDSVGNPATAVTGAKRLTDIEGAHFFITSLTGVTLAVHPIVAKEENIIFALTMSASAARKDSNVFRIYPGIEEEGKAMTEFVLKRNPSSVAIISLRQQSIEEQVERIIVPRLGSAGIHIVARESFDRVEQEARDIVAKISGIAPEMIVLNAYYNHLPILLEEIRKYPALQKCLLVSGLNLAVALELDPSKASLFDGAICAVPASTINLSSSDASSANERHFAETFRSKFQRAPNYDAAYAYDCLMILHPMVSRFGHDIPKIQQALRTSDFSAMTVNSFKIDENGNARSVWRIGKVTNGRIVPYDSPSAVP